MSTELLEQKIRQCQKGQPEAFAWLLEAYGPRLNGYFLRCCGSAPDAEDLLQELFLRLIERIQAYRHDGRFENWLFRVAANLVRDRYRQRQHIGAISLDAQESGGGGVPADDGPMPEARMEQKEQREILMAALGRLGEVDRQMILLRHYGEMSFKEIAKYFQVPLGTALAKVHRGLKTLQGILQQNGNEKET